MHPNDKTKRALLKGAFFMLFRFVESSVGTTGTDQTKSQYIHPNHCYFIFFQIHLIRIPNSSFIKKLQ
jgi:hypothetical protein